MRRHQPAECRRDTARWMVSRMDRNRGPVGKLHLAGPVVVCSTLTESCSTRHSRRRRWPLQILHSPSIHFGQPRPLLTRRRIQPHQGRRPLLSQRAPCVHDCAVRVRLAAGIERTPSCRRDSAELIQPPPESGLPIPVAVAPPEFAKRRC